MSGKRVIKYEKYKFLYHFDIVKKSICKHCGNDVPAQHKLSVEGLDYDSAEYLIKHRDKVKLHILSKELTSAKVSEIFG